MNKQLLTSLFLVFAVLSGNAQISIESSDMTSIGDQIIRWSDTIPTYGPGAPGAGVTWDFSGAQYDTVGITNVVSVGSTIFSGTFSSSDYAMTGVTDSYLFFEHDANSMTTTGAAGDLLNTGEQIESPFSDPLILHQFPRTYQSTFDDTYAFVTEADGAGLPTPIPVHRVRLTHTGHAYDTTDAYGTLITPEGTYDALRVKTVDFTTDHLEYKLLAFSQWATFSNTTDTSVSYSWHAKEEMLAIAEFAYDSLGDPARFTFSTVPPVVTTDLADVENDKEWSVYPQPATTEIFISGSSKPIGMQAEIYSMEGRLVKREQLRSNRMSTADLPTGIYLLNLTNTKGRFQKNIKIVLN